jgi:hypothetical protein
MKLFLFFLTKLSDYLGIKDLLKINSNILINNLYQLKKYEDPKCLTKYGYSVFSQGDEDGILEEIFFRIKEKNKIFIEIGIENGLENNSTNLMINDWQGFWIEGNLKWKKQIDENFKIFLKNKQLSVLYQFVNKENINEILSNFNIEKSNIDLLSIDIGLQTYHVLKSIEVIRPRVVVVEYNAKYGPSNLWAVKYYKNKGWGNDSYTGVSLKLLEEMMKDKGYSLVGCGITGANAFFVNNNENLNLFMKPFNSKTHFENEKFYLLRYFSSYHKKKFGDFEKK